MSRNQDEEFERMDQQPTPPPDQEGSGKPLVVARRHTADGEELQSASLTRTPDGGRVWVTRLFRNAEERQEKLPADKERARSFVAERLRGLVLEGWQPVAARQKERNQAQQERNPPQQERER